MPVLVSVIGRWMIACLAVSRSPRSVSWSGGSLPPPWGSCGSASQPLPSLPWNCCTALCSWAFGLDSSNCLNDGSVPFGPVSAGVPGSSKVQISVSMNTKPKKAAAPIRYPLRAPKLADSSTITDPGNSRTAMARARAPFTGPSASFRDLSGPEGPDQRERFEIELRALLVVALDREQVVDQVGDLLVVHGAAVAHAPGGHRRVRPALLDGLPGHLRHVLALVALPDLVQVGRGVVRRLGALHARDHEALDHPAGGVETVAAGAERLEGLLAQLDRLSAELRGRLALPARLADVEEGEQHGQEHRQHHTGGLVALEQPALQRLVIGAGAARRRQVPGGGRLLARGGQCHDQHGHDDEPRGEQKEEHDPLAHQAFSPPLTLPPMQCGPSSSWPVVLVPRGGPVTILEVSTTTWSPWRATAKRSSPRGAGPSLYSPAWLYLEPWQGHSHHRELSHHGTRQPRCTQRWYRAMRPAPLTPLYRPSLSSASS